MFPKIALAYLSTIFYFYLTFTCVNRIHWWIPLARFHCLCQTCVFSAMLALRCIIVMVQFLH
jgi:hypothetical protein